MAYPSRKTIAVLGVGLLTLVTTLAVIRHIGKSSSWADRPSTEVPDQGWRVPEDWKTYRNEEFGFEVSYPNDWVVVRRAPSEISPDAEFHVGFRPAEIVPAVPTYSDISFVGSNLSDPLDALRADEHGDYTWRIIDGEETKIGGITGYRHISSAGPAYSELIFFGHNEILYTFHSLSFDVATGDIREEIKNVFDGIILSFRLIN